MIRSCDTDKPKWKVAKVLWHRQVQVQSSQRVELATPNKVNWNSWALYCNLFYLHCARNDWRSNTLRMISIEACLVSIRRFYNRLRHFGNTWSVLFVRCKDVLIILIWLLFLFLHLQMLLYAFFAIFELVTFDVIYLKSVRVKHIDCLSLVVPLFVNYRDLGVDFLKLAQLLIDDYV